MKLKEQMVNVDDDENSILLKPSFEVSMKLLKHNVEYRTFIHTIVDSMKRALRRDYEDYDRLQGISGPNIGIPLKIVVIAREDRADLVMINPEIIRKSKRTYETESNCGSLLLGEKIKIRRHCWVIAEYRDLHGVYQCQKFSKGNYRGTVQHEIDHVNGIIIHERE